MPSFGEEPWAAFGCMLILTKLEFLLGLPR